MTRYFSPLISVKRTNRYRRKALYARLAKHNQGKVPCFVCGEHVKESEATLEHILPASRGGGRSWKNLAISHRRCNLLRGNPEYPKL